MCARFGRMVASVDPAVTSAATACVVRSRDVAARTACASPCRCVRPSGACRRRSGTAMTGTWRLATQPASGATIRIASPTLAGRRAAAERSGISTLNRTHLAIHGACSSACCSLPTRRSKPRQRVDDHRFSDKHGPASRSPHLTSPGANREKSLRHAVDALRLRARGASESTGSRTRRRAQAKGRRSARRHRSRHPTAGRA